jgi:hypothetical protein
MTPWHRELLERNKTGQKQGSINFYKKKKQVKKRSEKSWIRRLVMIRNVIATWLNQRIIVIL